MRNVFFKTEENEKLQDKIDWYDLYYGLIQKDKELNQGNGFEVIKNEFAETGYPVNLVNQ